MQYDQDTSISLYHPEKTIRSLSLEAVVKVFLAGWKEGILAVDLSPVSHKVEQERHSSPSPA